MDKTKKKKKRQKKKKKGKTKRKKEKLSTAAVDKKNTPKTIDLLILLVPRDKEVTALL
jgi:hypothetical protein